MTRERVEAELERIAGASGGVAGIAARLVGTDLVLGHRATEMFPMASTVKVPIALAVLEMVDQGHTKLTDMIAAEPLDMNMSSKIAEAFPHEGVSLSVHNLLEQMIVTSDNSATDMLLRVAGGPEGVQAWLDKVTLSGIRIDRTIRDLLCALFGIAAPNMSLRDAGNALSPEELADWKLRAQSPNHAYVSDPRDQAMPAAMVELLRRIARAEGGVSHAARETLVPIMRRTSTGLRRIEGRLPKGVPVANKTGSAAGTTNDIGLITLPQGRGTVAMAVFVKASPLPPAEREDIVADLARTAYDWFITQTDPMLGSD